MDSLVKKAYENWHEVVEYDGKVLNSQSNTRKGKTASVSATMPNYASSHLCETTQNRQPQLLPVPEYSRQFQPVNHTPPPPIPHLIDFPFSRPDQAALMALNSQQHQQQAALQSSMDYNSMSGGAGAVGCSYLSGDWSRPRGGQQGLEDIVAEEIRLRSSEMLESDDMQRLLRTFGVGVGNSDEACYSYSVQYEPQIDQTFGQERGKGPGKAVVGWLKLKAALRWGIFVRRRAAERRAQLTELD